MVLQTTLALAAAAALINLWLFIRVTQLRFRHKIMHGDGGNALLHHRIRAHANFAENTPLVLILIAGIELAGRGGKWLAIVGAAYMLARVAHVIGMDNETANPTRAAGAMVTLTVQIGLGAAALLIALGLL